MSFYRCYTISNENLQSKNSWFSIFARKRCLKKRPKESKMKPMPTTQRMLTWFYLLEDRNSTWWQKFAYIAFNLLHLAFFVVHVLGNMIFASKFLSIDLERSLYAICQFFCYGPLIYMLIVAFMSRHEITALFEELTMIYDASMCFIFNLKKKKTVI